MRKFTSLLPLRREWLSYVCRMNVRIVLLLLTITTTLNPLMAQQGQQRLSADLRNVPLQQVFDLIREKTSYSVNFVKEEVNAAGTKVSVQVTNAPVMDLLSAALTNTGYEASMDGNMIIVKQRPRQAASGIVKGQVIDTRTGDPVIGATIKAGNSGTATDVKGEYSLVLPVGTYTLGVSSIGYTGKQLKEVQISRESPFLLNITLTPQSGTLRGVEVIASARKESIAALYIRQKNNSAITDGISADVIARTPDKNIGESLRRISGLSTLENKYVVVRGLSERYNQAMLNGQAMPSTELNRKQFSFDVIPANMVDNVVVYKTITPDQSAEFGGGLVQINTKDLPDQNFLSLTVGGSINDKSSGKDMLSFQRDGSREYFGKYARHRYLFGQKDWNSLQEIRARQTANKDALLLSNNWQPYYYAVMPSQQYQLSFGRVMQRPGGSGRLGIIAAVSYRNTQSIQSIVSSRNQFEGVNTEKETFFNGDQYGFTTNIGGVAGIGYSIGKHKFSWQNVFTQLLEQQMNYGKGYHAVLMENTRAMVERVQQTNLWQSQLKGEHAIGKKGVRLQWIGSYIRVTRVRPDNHILVYKPLPDSLPLRHNEFTMAEFYPEGTGGANDTGALRLFSKAAEKNFSWDVAGSIPFKLGTSRNTFKTGYAGWTKSRQFYVALLNHRQGDLSSPPPIGEAFTPRYGGGTSTVSGFGDDYDRSATLHALYGMFDNRLGNKWRIVWGLRAEYYDMNAANQALDQTIAHINEGRDPADPLDFSALYNREKDWHLFPSANITYSLQPSMNIRAAYARSIIRPDLRELAWFREYDFELMGTYSADLLRSTTIDNYDLRYEWYPGVAEVLSASLFYKHLKFPMEIYKIPSNNIYILRNNYKSYNYGVELEVRKSLSFVHVPVIKQLTLYGNFTILSSRVTPMDERTNELQGNKVVPKIDIGKEEKRPLMGQSNYLFNAAIYYDAQHLNLTLSYNAVSNRLVVFEQNAASSQYERPLRSFDLQIAWRFLRQRAEVKLNISNLLRENSIIYANKGKTQEEEDKAQQGDYSSRYLLYDKHDYLVQELSPGRTYGLSITYTLR